jgi:hypothetical protein
VDVEPDRVDRPGRKRRIHRLLKSADASKKIRDVVVAVSPAQKKALLLG